MKTHDSKKSNTTTYLELKNILTLISAEKAYSMYLLPTVGFLSHCCEAFSLRTLLPLLFPRAARRAVWAGHTLKFPFRRLLSWQLFWGYVSHTLPHLSSNCGKYPLSDVSKVIFDRYKLSPDAILGIYLFLNFHLGRYFPLS